MKSPGKVRVLEFIKRFLLCVFYIIVGRIDKLLYYRSVKNLAQREVVAGKIIQHVLQHGPSFCSKYLTKRIARNMNFEYFLDGKNHRMLCQHIDNHHVAYNEKGNNYLGALNPLTMLALRKGLLGDEDYAKKSNYLVQIQQKTNKHLFIPIDFGMAFFNRCEKFYAMDFQAFTHWVTTLPLRKKVHGALFLPGESIMPLINSMTTAEKTQAAFMALAQMASLSDPQLAQLCNTLEDNMVKREVFSQLKRRANKALQLVEEALKTSEPVKCLFNQPPARRQRPSLKSRRFGS